MQYPYGRPPVCYMGILYYRLSLLPFYYIYTPNQQTMDSKELAYFLDACRRGDSSEVTQLCQLFPDLINAADGKGFTPLIIAVYSNHQEVVDILLQNGAN